MRTCHYCSSPVTTVHGRAVCPDCRARRDASARAKANATFAARSRHACADCGEPCDRRAVRCNACARSAPRPRKPRVYHAASGYFLVRRPDHPNANAQGYVREHVYVMAQHIGRAIAPGEVVHHVNGVRHDNRIENLRLMTKREHDALHARDRARPKG